LASVLIFVTGIAVEGHIHIQTDAISWVDPHAQSIKDIKMVKAGTGAANEIAVNVETNQPFSNQTVSYVSRISRQLNTKYPALLPAAGLVSTLDWVMNAVPGTNHVNPTGAQVEGLYLLAPKGIRNTTIANNGHAINIIFRAYPDTLSSLEPVVKDLQSGMGAPPGITVAPGGIAIVGVGLIENLESSRVLLTYLAVLFVGAFLAVRLRSIIRSLLSLVPVLVAVGATAIVAFSLHLKLSPVTAVTGPLVVAVCTEFTSLILLRFVEERERGYAPIAAMDATARRTGRAFLVSAMTAIAGIGTLAASPFPLLRDFGIIVALNVTVALLAALVILPPLLVAAESRGWVTRGLLGKKEVPFIEYGLEAVVADGPPPAVHPEPDLEPALHGTPNGSWPEPVLAPPVAGEPPVVVEPPIAVEPLVPAPAPVPVADHPNGDGHEPAWIPPAAPEPAAPPIVAPAAPEPVAQHPNGGWPEPVVAPAPNGGWPEPVLPPPVAPPPPLLAEQPVESWEPRHDFSVTPPPPPTGEPVFPEPVQMWQPAPPPPPDEPLVVEPTPVEPLVVEPMQWLPPPPPPPVVEPPVAAPVFATEPIEVEAVEHELPLVEAVVAEPVVAEPVVAEPVVAEPVVAEPVVAEAPVTEAPVAEAPE
ncbi:MAG TPA: MMPL family transporter, partial [Acidimicrobiales bacterium]|nr:MMPL family transporter [Acidimicrobiales bacterium]